jgi:hypothetical protein
LKSASWDVGRTYIALSRLPWLKALAAWSTCGTWTRGFQFGEDAHDEWNVGLPDDGDVTVCRRRYSLQGVAPVQFAAERRRGWREAADCPSRISGDLFDQRRNARLLKTRPEGGVHLGVESLGWAGGEFDAGAVEGLDVRYWLENGEDLKLLDDVQWADWDERGQLLRATRDAKLQICTLRGLDPEVRFEVDLALLEPNPQPAPAWALQW